MTIQSGPSTVLASGDNFEFRQLGAVVICRVWRRPDLSSQRGAANAADLARLIETYSAAPRPPPVLLDLTEGPTVMGPVTEQHLGKLFEGFERRKQPLAIVCGVEPLQRMQYQRLIATHAKLAGSVHLSLAEGLNALDPPHSRVQRRDS